MSCQCPLGSADGGARVPAFGRRCHTARDTPPRDFCQKHSTGAQLGPAACTRQTTRRPRAPKHRSTEAPKHRSTSTPPTPSSASETTNSTRESALTHTPPMSLLTHPTQLRVRAHGSNAHTRTLPPTQQPHPNTRKHHHQARVAHVARHTHTHPSVVLLSRAPRRRHATPTQRPRLRSELAS
jgi:hypothetical protein